MDTLLTSIDFSQLGVTGIFLAYLIWTNQNLRTENRAEREANAELSRLLRDLQAQSLEAISDLRETLVIIQERLK